jgi:hypothetical protein
MKMLVAWSGALGLTAVVAACRTAPDAKHEQPAPTIDGMPIPKIWDER